MNKIKYYWWRTREHYWNIRDGIKSLYYWVPVIWRDEYHRPSSIYKILKAKLKRYENSPYQKENNSLHVINLVLDRLIGADYDALAGFEQYYRKWGEPDMYLDEQNIMQVNYPNVKTARDEKIRQREFSDLLKHSDYLRRQDIEYMAHILKKNDLRW